MYDYQKYRNWKYHKNNPILAIFKTSPEICKQYIITVLYNPNIIYIEKHILENLGGLESIYFEGSPYLKIDFYDKLSEKGFKVDWRAIASKRNITMDIIEKHPKLKNLTEEILRNPNITEQFLDKIEDKKILNYEHISCCENISIKWILKNLGKIDMYRLSERPNLNQKIVEEWIDLPWNWGVLSCRKFSVQFIMSHLNKPWDWVYLSSTMPEKDIKKAPDLPWVKSQFLYNTNLSSDFLKEQGYKNERVYSIKSVKNITDNIDCSQNLSALCLNENLSFDFYEKNIDKLDFQALSKNSNLTAKFILKHKNKNWDWGDIINNLFLFNNNCCKKSMKNDIYKRRKMVKKNLHYGDISRLILLYVGYK